MKQIVRQATYKTTQWSGGITREICIFPATASLAARNFDVRISSAVIDTPESNFSDFTGYRRYLMPLNGEIVLYPSASEPQSAAENGAVGEENAVKLSATDLFEFDGAQPMRSRNTPGAIDFNVIVRPHRLLDQRHPSCAPRRGDLRGRLHRQRQRCPHPHPLMLCAHRRLPYPAAVPTDIMEQGKMKHIKQTKRLQNNKQWPF